MTSPPPVLEAVGLRLVRSGPGGRFTLDIAALHLGPGQLVSLQGPSGSGKSTCLEILAGIVAPDAAQRFSIRTRLETLDLSQKPSPEVWARLRTGPVGFGPQTGGLLPFLNAGANARAALSLSGRGRRRDLTERFDALANVLGLTRDDLHKHRDALSGGQRKRVSLLRALAVPRALLVLDEPTIGLDDALAESTMHVIAQLCAAEGTACIAAMHDRGRALRMGFSPLTLATRTDGATVDDLSAQRHAA